MRILLVDDSSTMRRIQKNQLTALGLKDIIEAEDGKQAQEKLKAGMPVDVVLLDWNMPEMDGMAFLKIVRADATYNDVKIIMCTSESEKAKVLECLKAGANDYMVKPFTPESLQKKLGI
ncbi:MAG: response regulator [Chitinivibrionales bacterium]|nr:response regulator [Chitinivibrionales bacterium]MBD3395414.1 response regulator [Chitinivibrionales bacterium]